MGCLETLRSGGSSVTVCTGVLSVHVTVGTWAILVLYCECYICSYAAVSPTYVHDALGYFHYAMQFPRTFGFTCFMGTITLG